ncbi:MAG TPA: Coenzyme F420 hydrogenase/dehydrogenase, beta subunit C-terminal domain [Candidatus Binatia bacterium]|nr:Coenzyme F420 hydrogenase/dehydrogenase, beta subunit C-terminal domain [Candidatus Binatia bacterium]
MPDSNLLKYQKFKTQEEAKIEKDFLKGIQDEDFGMFCDIFSAKAIFEGQDGGVVTALLVNGFDEGFFDAAVVVLRGEGYSAEAVVATNANEVLVARGTKYLRVNVIEKLRELISQGKKRIAVVGTPCEVKAARKIQQVVKSDCEITIIGLFCSEAFNSPKLKEEIRMRLNVDLDTADKTEIRHGKFSAFVDGKEYGCKVKDLHDATEKACSYCDDFTARFADISVGSVGSKKGFSTVIVRSKAGEKLLKNLDIIKQAVDKEEIIRLAKFKRERAKKCLAIVNNLK